MIKAYIDFPGATITVHRKPNCPQAKAGPNQNIRHVIVNADNVSKELEQFRSDKYKFATEEGKNDLSLILDFNDPVLEEALVGHIKRLIGLNYEEITNCESRVHC